MGKVKARKLVAIRPDEVSLVDTPANNYKFQVIKGLRREEMSEELKALIASFAPGDGVTAQKAVDASAVQGALEVLAGYRDDLAPDMIAAIGTLASAIQVDKAAEGGTKAEGNEETTVEELVEKIGARISKETKSALDGVLEAVKAAQKALSDLLRDATVQKAFTTTTPAPEEEKAEKATGDAEKTYTQAEVDKLVADAVAAAEEKAAEEGANFAADEVLADLKS